MPSNPELFYLTAADYKPKTTVPSLVSALSDDAAEELLLEAMASIDAYIGKGWPPFEDEQEFIFPRSVDEDSSGDAFIPRSVAIATRMVADAILQKRQNGGKRILPSEVASESNLGHSYTKVRSTVERPTGFQWWPEEVFAFLEPYVRRGGYLGLDETDVL